MTCQPAQSNFSIRLPDIVAGDSWGPIFVAHSTTGSALDSDLASVTMIFKDSAGNVGLSLANGSGITITDANAWAFSVDQILTFPLAAGTWSWAIRATNAAGTRITRLAGTKTVKP